MWGTAVLLVARPAAAHVGAAHATDHWWTAWNWQPSILVPLVLLAGLYVCGLRRLWRRAGMGRGISRAQAAAYGGAIFALFLALISPMDPLSDQFSSIHMIQHMTLMMVAAPLFVLGAPLRVIPWSLPWFVQRSISRWRRSLESYHSPWYLLWQPLLLWALYAFTLWVWHLPLLYEAALHNPFVHDVQHITFFVAACLFWRVLVDPVGRLRLGRGIAVLYLFTTSMHAMLLGVFMALSPRVWYRSYEGRTQAWNLTALEDQQLAGLIMWMPACSIYAVAAVWLFILWIRNPADRRWGDRPAGLSQRVRPDRTEEAICRSSSG